MDLALNDVIRAQYVCSDAEQVSINTVYYQVVGVGSPAATLEDFAVNFSTRVAPLIKPIINNVAIFQEVIAQVINPLPLKARVIENGDSGVGTGGAIGIARQAAGLIKFSTALAGPGFRGRNYLPFVPAALCAGGGFPAAGYNAGALALQVGLLSFVALSNGGRTGTVQQVLWKRAGSIVTQVIDGSTSGRFATQKRRSSYGRPNTVPT